MPQVPTYQRQVPIPRPRPNLEQAEASPAAFGAQQAQAISQAGAQVTQSALQVGEIAADIRARQAENDSLEAFNKLNEALRKRMYDDQDAFYSRQGKAASEAVEALPGEYARLLGEVGQDLSPQAREIFDRVAGQRGQSIYQDYSRYARSQMDRHLATEEQSLQQTAIGEVAADPLAVGAEALLDMSLQRIRQQGRGKSHDEIKLEVDTLNTQARSAAIDTLIRSDPRTAVEYYEKHKDGILGTARAGIEAKLERGMETHEGQIAADEAFNEHGRGIDDQHQIQAGLVAAIDAIVEKHPLGPVRDNAVSRVKALFGDQERFLVAEQRRILNTTLEGVEAAPSQEKALSLLETDIGLDREGRQAVRHAIAQKFAPGEIKTTIENAFNTEMVREAILDGRSLGEDGMPITTEDIRDMSLRYGFTPAQFQGLLETHKQWNEGVFVPPADIKRAFEDVNPGIKWDQMNHNEAGYLIQQFQREAQRLGKAPTDRQIYEIMVGLSAVQSGWGGGPRWRLEARGAEFNPESVAVPPADAARIREDWTRRRKGVPTSAQLSEEYARDLHARSVAAGMRRTDIAAASAVASEQQPAVVSVPRAQAEVNLANAPESVRQIIFEENRQPTLEEWPNPSPLENASSFKYLLSVESAESAAARRGGYDGLPSNVHAALDRGQAYASYLDQKYKESDGDIDRMIGTVDGGSNVLMRQMERFVPNWVEAARVYFQWRNEERARSPEVTAAIEAVDALTAGESGRRTAPLPMMNMTGY